MLGRFWIWARKAFNRPITGKLCKCDAQRFGLELEQEYGYGFNNSCRFSIEPSDFGLSAIRCLWQRSLSATCSWFFVHIGTIIGINLFLQSSSRLTLPDVKLLSMNTHQTYPDLSCEGRCDPRNQSPWAQSGTESRAQSTRTSSTDSTLPIPIPLFPGLHGGIETNYAFSPWYIWYGSTEDPDQIHSITFRYPKKNLQEQNRYKQVFPLAVCCTCSKQRCPHDVARRGTTSISVLRLT